MPGVLALALSACQSATGLDLASSAAAPAVAAPTTVQALAATPSHAGGACAIALPGGPPRKPVRAADFALVSTDAAGRGEGDVRGAWTITDGSPNCGCRLEMTGRFRIAGRKGETGQIRARGCGSPALARMAVWHLGYAFTGYDAKLDLKAPDGETVLATLNREGVHHFSGRMADGTPVTLWRDAREGGTFAAR